ncbi:MAG: metallophosphoesterase [Clostridia bacterium]|nr:metallophosphoesterase [Clostridia bacterium]
MKKFAAFTLLFSMILATLSLTVTVSADSAAKLTTDKTTYYEGEPIIVNASSTNSSGKDWLGITVKGDVTGASIRWNYLNEIGENFDIREASRLGKNRNSLYSIPAGEYTVFIIPDDHTVKSGYDKRLASIDITVIPNPNSTEKIPELTLPDKDTYIVTDKTEYFVGETVYVAASSANAGGKDWIGIFPKGHIGPSIYWDYISTVGKGKTFDIEKASNMGSSMSDYFGLPAGEYTLYIIPDDLTGKNGIGIALASLDIKIVNDPSKIAKAPLSATYKLKNDTDGMADGTLTINLPEDHMADDIYMWWANDAGKLEGYTRLARFKVTGTTVTHEMTPNTIIPEGATKLLIYTYNDSNGISGTCLEVKLPDGAASKGFGKVLSEFQIVSDIHIKGDASNEYSKHFIGMLNDVVKNSPDSVGIFAVGDIVDRGDSPSYWTYFHQHYNSVKNAPALYLGIGNHEYIGTNYDAGLKQFLENLNFPDGSTPDKPYYDVWVNGYHYIFIASETTGASKLTKTQLNWLEEKINENRDGRPIFVFHHQPMLNTTSGSSQAEGWSGVSNHTQLKAVVNKYPEVMFFNGHTHWILDSDNCMYKGNGASYFNTSSVAYLWHSYDIVTGERQTGSEGYYIRIYEDKVAVLGRNFVTGEWVSSAQFLVSYTQTKTDETTTEPEVTTEPVTTPEVTEPASTEPEATPAPEQTEAPDETEPTVAKKRGCSSVASPIAIIAVIALGAAVIKKRK